jgi:hypothetical protein
MKWTDALAQVQNDRIEKPAHGFQTRQEVHAAMKLSAAQGDKAIKQLLAAGIAERRDYYTKTGKGICKVPHYRLKAGR